MSETTTGLRGRMGAQAALVLLVLLVCALAPGAEVATPTREDDDANRQGWVLWPFVRWRQAPDESLLAIHPFYSRVERPEAGERQVDVLWPLWTWSHRERTPGWENRTTSELFALWYSTQGRKEGQQTATRYLFPFYWQGHRESGGDYLILFPFYWRANDAKLAFPIFPRRPQNIRALWPFWGDFRGFWNRDRIEFAAWPLFVRSTRGEGDERLVQTSVPWPFLSWISGGGGLWGFRAWPLVAYVERPGELKRAYWLWPLGHYRVEGQGDERREVNAFIPLWGRVRSPEVRFDMVFPFYGRLDMAGRRTRGWALALYNQDDNLRTGVREHRVLWFIGRWTSRIPVDPAFADAEGQPRRRAMEGGGVFPFYVRRSNGRTEHLLAPWPFHVWRRTTDPDLVFDRRYVLPFYARQTSQWQDGRESQRRMIFPLWREIHREDGSSYQSAPHLFPYTEAESVDRNWAPLWTLWSREVTTGRKHETVVVAGPVWRRERNWLGVERRRLNLGLVSWEAWTGPERPDERRVGVLWGAVRYDRLGAQGTWRLFGRSL